MFCRRVLAGLASCGFASNFTAWRLEHPEIFLGFHTENVSGGLKRTEACTEFHAALRDFMEVYRVVLEHAHTHALASPHCRRIFLDSHNPKLQTNSTEPKQPYTLNPKPGALSHEGV